MKNWIVISTLLISFSVKNFAQTENNMRKSIAVATPYVNNLASTAEGLSKMTRLELIKLNVYNVYDEFDMKEVIQSKEEYKTGCYGQSCLIKLGEALGTDYILFGSFDGLSNRIVVNMKLIDVKNQTIFKSVVREFDDQEFEIQRMIEIVIKELNNLPMEKEIISRLEYKNEPITSNNVGLINNSGPRIGVAYLHGAINEFATRPESQGGLNIQPIVSMIGYQFEKQYVGTDNFSALVECIVNISGLEQGQFIPTLTLMNGFRFGKAGWEFAFGPGIGIKKTSQGFFDSNKLFRPDGGYMSESDWTTYADNNYKQDSAYYINGIFQRPSPTDFNSNYVFDRFGDTRGDFRLNTSFVFGFGRTFNAGALNIPVNLFYSSQKGGGMVGVNVGFNIQKSKIPIHK